MVSAGLLPKGLALLLLFASFFTGGTPASVPTPTPPVTGERLIRASLSSEPASLDPALATDTGTATVLTNLFEGLTRDAGYGPFPALAERWEIDAAGTTYTFHLREGLRWSNGDPLTAEDFVYAWTRVLDPKIASPYAFQLSYIKGGLAFSESDPHNPAAYEAAKAALGLKAPDARTLVVTLEAPTPYFAALTSTATLQPVPRRLVETNPDWAARADQFVANGPYKLVEWDATRLVMVKNPTYWNAQVVAVDRLIFPIIPDVPTAVNLFNAEELEFVPQPDEATVAELGLKAYYRSTPAFATNYYIFNLSAKPFDDVRVRRALSLALDRKALVQSQGWTNEPLRAIVPMGAPDGPMGFDFRMDGGDLLTEDLNEARRLLAEAGYPNGQGFPEVRFIVNDSMQVQKGAERVVAMWRERLGITSVNLIKMPFRDLLSQRTTGRFGIARGSWIGDYRDPMTFLELWVTGSPMNVAHYTNPEFDRLIQRAKAASEPSVRMKAMHEAEALLMREMPAIPLYQSMNTYLQSPKLSGGLFYNPLGSIDFTFAQLR